MMYWEGSCNVRTMKIMKRDKIIGDCPVVDPQLIDELVEAFTEKIKDYLSNCTDEGNLTVPDGFDAEVFKKAY